MGTPEIPSPTSNPSNECRTLAVLLQGVCDTANSRPGESPISLLDFGQDWASRNRHPDCSVNISGDAKGLKITCAKFGKCCLATYGTTNEDVADALKVPLIRPN